MELLPLLPEFSNLLSKKLYEGKKILVHCRKGTTICASAVMVMLIIKRGIVDDPSRTGLPYMRLDEMMELYNKRHPSPSISDAFVAGLEHFNSALIIASHRDVRKNRQLVESCLILLLGMDWVTQHTGRVQQRKRTTRERRYDNKKKD